MSETQGPKPVSVEAALSENGITVKSHSHFVAELDMLFGDMLAGLRFKTGLGNYVKRERMMREQADALQRQLLAEIESRPPTQSATQAVDDSIRLERVEAIQNTAAVFDHMVEQTRLLTDTSANEAAGPATSEASADGAHDAPQPDLPKHDAEWLAGIKTMIENASTERLQLLFGRILAGELTSPTDISVGSIRTISELSPTVAKLFEKYSILMLDDFLVLRKESGGLEIPFLELRELEDFGLLYGDLSSVTITASINEKNRVLINARDMGLYMCVKDGMANVTIEGYRLTATGRSLSRIIANDQRPVARRIVEAKKDIIVFAIYGKLLSDTDGRTISPHGSEFLIAPPKDRQG